MWFQAFRGGRFHFGANTTPQMLKIDWKANKHMVKLDTLTFECYLADDQWRHMDTDGAKSAAPGGSIWAMAFAEQCPSVPGKWWNLESSDWHTSHIPCTHDVMCIVLMSCLAMSCHACLSLSLYLSLSLSLSLCPKYITGSSEIRGLVVCETELGRPSRNSTKTISILFGLDEHGNIL